MRKYHNYPYEILLSKMYYQQLLILLENVEKEYYAATNIDHVNDLLDLINRIEAELNKRGWNE